MEHRVLSPEEATVIYKFDEAPILEELNKLPESEWAPHLWYDSADNVKASSEQDPSVWVPRDGHPLAFLSAEVTIGAIKHYIASTDLLAPPSSFSGARFNRYSVGAGMHAHVDHIYSLFLPAKERGIPVLSIVASLNENYGGGEFILRGKSTCLKAGEAIIFPSNFLFPHEVKPVIKGERLSYVSWAW
jgi:hypothetical protein